DVGVADVALRRHQTVVLHAVDDDLALQSFQDGRGDLRGRLALEPVGGRQWRERAGQALAVGLVAGRAVGLVGLLAGGGIGGCSLAEGLVGPAGEQGGNETEGERLAFHRRAPGAACGQTSSILILDPIRRRSLIWINWMRARTA